MPFDPERIVALREREKCFTAEHASVSLKRFTRQQRFFLPVSPQEFGATRAGKKIFSHPKRL